MKRISWLLCAAMLLGLLAGCGGPGAAGAEAQTQEAPASAAAEGTGSEANLEGSRDEMADYTITLNGDSITAEGAQVSGSVVTITAAGNYHVSGTLDDGQIIVEAGKKDDIRIILEGVDITCSNSAPIYVKNAMLVNIWLAEGTQNVVTDGTSYDLAEGQDEPDAAIFAKDSLAIVGEGSLTVHGNYNMGIHGKDDLLLSADVTVDAVGDGVKGKDAVYLAECTLRVTAGADGIQSNNDVEGGDITIQSGQIVVTAEGDGIKAEHALEITGGTVNVTAGEDGLRAKNTIGGGGITLSGGEITLDTQGDAIQSDGDLLVEDGVLTITTLGGADNAPVHVGDNFGGPGGWFNDTTADDESQSAKGIKASGDITITGGSMTLDTYDDAIHSDSTVTISGTPQIVIAAGDDAIHADDHLSIEDGTLQITQSYEGLEAVFIDISGGDIYLKASDDGMNANGEEMFGPGFGGMGGQSDSLEDAACYLHISGGHIVMDASGDGLDSNGFLLIEGGETYVSGPSNSGNGALDFGTSAQITGGTVVAMGASGMDETFSSASTQPSIKCTFSVSMDGSTPVTLADSQGNVLVECAIETEGKSFNSVVISCPELTLGQTYTLTCGDESAEVELASVVTTVRQSASGTQSSGGDSGMFGFGMFGPPGGGFPGP